MTPVVVDTSVWVEHFRQANLALTNLLVADRVLTHPMVLCELACGTPPMRTRTLADLGRLRPAHTLGLRDLMDWIERESLFGQGCGLMDLSLLASTLTSPAAQLWTLDKRLTALAQGFGVLHASSVPISRSP